MSADAKKGYGSNSRSGDSWNARALRWRKLAFRADSRSNTGLVRRRPRHFRAKQELTLALMTGAVRHMIGDNRSEEMCEGLRIRPEQRRFALRAR